jgi:hypothetical protein
MGRRYKLTKLRIERCDLVTAGANQHAQVLLFKAAPKGDGMDMAGMDPAMRRRMAELRRRLEAGEITQAEFDAEMARMKARGKPGMSKGAEGAAPDLEGGDPMSDTDQLAELAKAIDDAVAKATAPLTDQIATLERERDEAVAKAAPPPDPLAGIPADIRKRLDDQALEIEKMRDERETERWTGVAKGYDRIAKAAAPGGNGVDELAAALKTVAKTAPAEALDAILRALGAGQDAAEVDPSTTEIGSAGSPATVGQAEATVTAKAAEVKKGEPRLTDAQALAKALDDLEITDPDVVRAYAKELADA